MNRFALIVGLEHFGGSFSPIRFAGNDAAAFQDVLINLGYDSRDVTCLIDEQATKANIGSEVKRLKKFVQSEDEISLYFVGHGISLEGSNYLICYDSTKAGLKANCIELQWVFDELKASGSKHIVLFLDLWHNRIDIKESIPDKFEAINLEEIEAYFADSETEVCFTSCNADESSYGSTNERHGIWASKILEALRGKCPHAVENNSEITSASLQDYLAREVPGSLKIENPNPVCQSPQCFGNYSREYLVFHVEDIIKQNWAKRKSNLIGIRAIDLLGSQSGAIKQLSGFKKGVHRLPGFIDDFTQGFVEEIASVDVQTEASRIHAQLKENFGYKRREIKLSFDGSSAEIATKDFDLTITYSQDLEDASSYSKEYLITNVRNGTALSDPGLQTIFDKHFDEVRLSVKGKIDLEELIDSIELEDNSALNLEYPPNCNSLTLSPTDAEWSIQISNNSISIVNQKLESPTKMLRYFKDSQDLTSKSPLLNQLLG